MKYLAHALLLILPPAASSATLYKYVPYQTVLHLDYGAYHIGSHMTTRVYNPAIEKPGERFPFLPRDLFYPARLGEPTASRSYEIIRYDGTIDVPLRWEGELKIITGLNNSFSTKITKYATSGSSTISDYDGPYTVENNQNHMIYAQCPVPDYIYAGRQLEQDSTVLTVEYQLHNEALQTTFPYKVQMICINYYRVVTELKIEIEKPVMDIDARDISLTHENRIKLSGFGGPGTRARVDIENPNTDDVTVTFSKSDPDMEQTTITPTDSGAWATFYVKLKRKQPGSKQYNINFTARYD